LAWFVDILNKKGTREMNANELDNEGIVTQLAVVHTMLPKVKELIDKQAEEIEYWKSAFERSMSLYDQVKHLEAQVYGGTTK
jgi:hypothetical protein